MPVKLEKSAKHIICDIKKMYSIKEKFNNGEIVSYIDTKLKKK